jgi:hypothetical protein
MKDRIKIALLFSLIVVFVANSQVKTRKQLKEEQKLEKQKQIALLMDSKDFVFVGTRALPQGYRNIDLTSNPNFVNFQPAFIKSEMPYFGRSTGSVAYGGGGGLNFEGIPEDYTFTKENNFFIIKAVVRDAIDSYKIILKVFLEGGASLTIISNTRSSITYTGSITKATKT